MFVIFGLVECAPGGWAQTLALSAQQRPADLSSAMPTATPTLDPTNSSRQNHSRARSASVPLDSAIIASAVNLSSDAGKTLDFSLKHIGEVSEDAASELARIGRDDLDEEGIVTR